MERVGDIESKIIFEEGDDIRVLRGIIESEDEFFVTLKRKDGIFKIAKRKIVRIEQINHTEEYDAVQK
jgi:hypothetical protein